MMPISSARELPELRYRIATNPTMPRWYAGLWESHRLDDGGPPDASATTWAVQGLYNLATCPLHYVGENFCELVRAGAPSLPLTTTISAVDVPSETGIIYFALPFPYFAAEYRHETYWAVQWVQTGNPREGTNGVLAWWFGDQESVVAAMLNPDAPIIEPDIKELYADPKHRAQVEQNIRAGPPMVPVMSAQMGYDLPLSTLHGMETPGDPYWFLRYLVTTWLLQKQRVTVTSETMAPRATQRRLQRAGWDGDDHSRVRIIDLAAAHGGGDSAGSREYRHRWVVDGHWRQQWYPSTQSHRPVWIHPYVKGPADAPLLTGEKVYRWTEAG